MRASHMLSVIGLSILLAPQGVRGERGKGSASRAQAGELQGRDRLVAEVHRLRAQKKLDDAVAFAQKLVALDRELFSSTHPQLAVSLQLLAELHGLRGDYPAAREAAKEMLRFCLQLP